MFEYQTAISELTGLPVSNASVYEGPSAVGAAGYVARTANKRPKFVASAGLHPHSLETLRTLSHGYGTEVVELPLRDGATDPDALAAAVDDDTGAVFLQQPNFLGAIEDLDALAARGQGHRRAARRRRRPDPAGPAQAAGRIRRRPRRRGGAAAGQPPGLRRPVLRVLRRHRGAAAAHARAHRGRDHRRRRPARVRADAADARAAHPAREGDLEHLHRAGAQRAVRDGLPGLARAARDGRAGRAAGAADGICARHPGRARRRGPAARAAGGARVRAALDAPAERVRERCFEHGIDPGCAARWRATACSSPSPSSARGRTSTGWPRCSARPCGRSSVNRPLSDNRLHADPEIEGFRPIARRDPAVQTAQQRDRATTIYERSVEGRRAFVPPALGVPERRWTSSPRAPAPQRGPEAARGLRAGDRAPLRAPVDPELPPRRGLLPARLVHDEAQPQAARARGGAGRLRPPAPAAAPEQGAGRAGADVAAAGRAGRDRRAAARLAAAQRGLARRAGRRPAHARLPRGPRRAAHEGAHARHRARHEPGHGHDGRLRGGQGRHRPTTAASTSRTCGPRPTTRSRA